MDHEYIQNVMGSPFVNEGEFSRLKARGAQAMGAMGAMVGHQIQNPAETKLRSLWEGFISSLKKAMKDWEGQVAPMFDEQVPLNEKQQQAKDSLDTLARLLSSVGPQKSGTFDPNYNVGGRNQRDNPNTYVKGSAYNRSTTSPLKTPTKLTELVDEGFWDAANRNIGLNKSLGSNDPSTILDSYKNRVISIFQGFMKDAVKMTKMTAQQIYALLAKMQPSKGGWQAAGNMQKTVEQLKVLQGLGDIKGQGAPPVIPGAGVPPQQPPQPSGAAPDATQQPQQPPQQPSGAAPDATQQPPAPAADQGMQGGEGGTITPNEIPYIILHAIRIINDAVTSDEARTGKFFTAELPVDYSGPSLTKPSLTKESKGWLLKEIHSNPKPKKIGVAAPEEEPDSEDPGDSEEKEIPGEFLYNFHGKFSKHPTHNFAIEVKPVKLKPDVPDLPGVTIAVFWNCTKGLNRIYVVSEKNGKKSKPLMIMQFQDNHVSSEAGATTPGHSNQFSVGKVVQASNPNAESKLKNAPPDVLAAIKKEEDVFQRALMVTTYRKSMEFKSKRGKKIFPIKCLDDTVGNISYKDEDTKQWVEIDQAAVKEKLKGEYESAKKWEDSLAYVGYFEKFPSLKPSKISEFPSFKDAVMALVALKYGEPEATKWVSAGWMELRQKFAKLEDITSEELIKAALNKEKEFKAQGDKAKGGMGKILPSPASAPSTPVSKPAGAPAPSTPPTAPVSKPASGPAPTTTPTAPISSPGGSVPKKTTGKLPTIDPKTGKVAYPTGEPGQPTGKPEPDKGKQPDTAPQAKGAATPGDKHGKVTVSGNDIEWEHPKTHEVHTISPEEIEATAKKNPKFAAALKANPELYNKYKAKIDKQQGGEENPPVKEHFTYINPFNRDNLLY